MSANTSKALLKRDEVEEKYKWKLEAIYTSIDEWQKDFEHIKTLASQITAFKGTLSNKAENLLNCLRASDELLSLTDKMFVYARMKRDEDNSNTIYQELTDKASALSTTVYASVSFIVPEITSMPSETLDKYLKNSNDLKLYNQYISELLRQKGHILSEKEEEILAMSADVLNAPHDIFTMFNNADIKFPFIKDEYGNEVELTKGRYTNFLESSDRRVREDAFKALYKSYSAFKNTLGTTLTGNIKTNLFHSKIRKYPSCLSASLDSDNISTDVYNNLIETINKNLPLLHRYLRLRKKALRVDELHMYDLYTPMVEDMKKNISYAEALTMVEKGLEPMGSEYIGYLKNGFESGWIDVYENEGKTSGAYSWGTHLTHPFVLLNYQGNINDVFTLAHEMGHALHSYYTNMTQPYIYSEYKIFVAEVASTVNESLLMRYLLNNTSDKKEKAYLINHYLEEFRGTVFRQVMFAEFEKLTHRILERDEALTSETFCKIYRELNEKYYGPEVLIDSEIDMEWARIPHFYSSFYVYKYATGFSAATSLSQQILSEGTSAVERYKSFLKSGGSDYPLNLLKNAGVDLSDSKPIQDALDVFSNLLDQLEELI